MVEPVGVGVIGLGIIGRKHLEEYLKRSDVRVVGVADVNREALEWAAKRGGVPNVYTDFRLLLKNDEVQAVDVCVHNNLHAPIAIECLRAGKHVYVEKPLAGSYADGRAMVEVAKQCGRMLHMQLDTVFTPQTKAAKAIIDGGRLGKVFLARASGYRRRGRPFVDGYGTKFFVEKEWAGGGALLDTGVYALGQILYLLGNPKPSVIKGRVFQEMPMNEERRRESGFNVEELAVGFAELENDVSLEVFEAWAVNLGSVEGSYIVGSLGGLRIAPWHREGEVPLSYHTSISDIDADSVFDLKAYDFRRHAYNRDEDAYDSSLSHWVAALQKRVGLLPTAQLGLNHLLLTEGVYMSSKLRREVAAEEVEQKSVSTAVKV
ncbi:MAG: Gfo/Idh/MocA family oxidoreductase [Thermoprotei archaeon]